MSRKYYEKKRKKRRAILIAAGVLLLLFCGLTFWFQQSEKKAESTYGEISGNGAVQEEILEEPEKIEEKPLRCLVIDVGDALSVLVDMGDTEVLYDCGYAKDGKKVSSSIRDYVEGNLDYLILSHSHADHIGGAARVLRDYNVETIITSGEREGDSGEFDISMKAAEKEGCKIIEDDDLSFDLGDGLFMNIIETLDPGKTDNVNDLSVIAHFERGEDSILITGDAESEAERYLLGKIGKVGIFIAGHHMSSTSNSTALLNQWQPSYIVASCAGEKSEYGLPHKKALLRCQAVCEEIYGTYKSGDVLLTMTGEEIKIDAEEDEKIIVQ